MNNSKMGVLVSLRLRLCKRGRFSKMLSFKLVLKRLVSSLWKQRLLFKDGPNAHRFLKHNDAGSQIHTKINHGPVNSLSHIFLLFNNKHVVVEELLKFLVYKVDRDLFKAVIFKNLKSSNVQDSAKVGLFHSRIN